MFWRIIRFWKQSLSSRWPQRRGLGRVRDHHREHRPGLDGDGDLAPSPPKGERGASPPRPSRGGWGERSPRLSALPCPSLPREGKGGLGAGGSSFPLASQSLEWLWVAKEAATPLSPPLPWQGKGGEAAGRRGGQGSESHEWRHSWLSLPCRHFPSPSPPLGGRGGGGVGVAWPRHASPSPSRSQRRQRRAERARPPLPLGREGSGRPLPPPPLPPPLWGGGGEEEVRVSPAHTEQPRRGLRRPSSPLERR